MADLNRYQLRVSIGGDMERRRGSLLAAALREAREAAGLRQRDVAEAVGVTASYVTMLERGALPSAGLVPRLIAALRADATTIGRAYDAERVRQMAADLTSPNMRERVLACLREIENDGNAVREVECQMPVSEVEACDYFRRAPPAVQKLVTQLLRCLAEGQ